MKAESHSRDDHQAAFEQLYQAHGREVWSVAYGRYAEADFARDITQEVFLRLWKLLESGEVLENPRAWLLRVSRNLAEDVANSAFRRNGTQPPEQFTSVNSRELPPLERLEQDESFAQVRKLLDELNPADREILLFRYALDLSCEEIAERFETTIVAVHMRLSRARQRFADRLTALGVQPSDLISE
jgi:RNA polymerase sigma-70 factor, ECF subfamily